MIRFCLPDLNRKISNKNFSDCKLNDDIDMLNEKMSVSFDAYEETKKLVKLLNKALKDKSNLQNVQLSSEIGSRLPQDVACEQYKFISPLVTKVFGCDCVLGLDDDETNIYNFLGNCKEKDICAFLSESTSIGGMAMGHKIKISTQNQNKKSMAFGEAANTLVNVDFHLKGDIVFINNKISVFTTEALAHELRHAYERSKMYGNTSLLSVYERKQLHAKWEKIYKNACDFIYAYKDTPFKTMMEFNQGGIVMESFFKTMYSLYVSDTSEISAFTQGAYEVCSKCKTKKAVDDKLQNSALGKAKSVYEDVLSLFMIPRFAHTYDEMILKVDEDILPAKEMEKFLRKRYKKLRTNYSNVKALCYDEIDTKNGVVDSGIKY